MNTKFTDVIRTSNGYVLVDTCEPFDCGWETMVFKCNKTGKVTKWADLDCERYPDREHAELGHYEMIHKWLGR